MGTSKNKLLTALVALLVLGNLASLAFLWLHKAPNAQPPTGARADAFITRELKLDRVQQEQYHQLMMEHRRQTQAVRMQIRDAKDAFFALLQNPGTTDSSKKQAAANVSRYTEELDLLTFEHFQKLRAICNPVQQQRFDEIIHQVIGMMGQGPGGRPPGGPQGGSRSGPPDRPEGPPPPPGE